MNTPIQPASPSALESDLALLIDAVREAGALALTFFGNAPHSEIKPDGTAVSEADLAVDALLKARLLQGSRNAYGWLSEESEDTLERLNHTRVWIVDPIDGTRAFLKGKPEWTISAALVEDGRSLLAAVFNPAVNEFYHAARGGGAFLNGARMKVCEPVKLEGCRLAASATLFRPERWDRPWPEIKTMWVNSIAYRLALVAAGTCDGTISLSAKNDWDIAAAHLLVEEACGIITTHDAQPLVYNRENTRHRSIVSAGPALHAALIERTWRQTIA
ncbi:MAG: 3'(2'),5'-bisphosphate nucleotidase CysQ [Proteobacteria bacterium]|nr:3'(2'),5'-bisphosphate nucleotidase CysQ [Pseudomonadota bacterium]